MRMIYPVLTRRLGVACGAGFAILAISACSGKDAPATDAAGSAPAATAGAPPTAGQETTDVRNIATYPLTETHVNQVLQVMRTVQSMEKADPTLEATWRRASSAAGPESLDAAVARISKMPRSAEIFGKAGISPRDFIYTMSSLMYSTAAYQLKQSGQTAAASKMAADVNPANMDFIAMHPQVIKELSAIDSAGNSSSE